MGTAYTYPGYGSYPTAVAQAQAASNSTGNSTAGAGAVAGAGSTGTIISLPSRTPSASALATYEGSAARVGGSALGLVIAGGIALVSSKFHRAA